MQVHVPDTQGTLKILQRQSLRQRKVYCRAKQEGGWLMPRKIPNSLKGFSKALFFFPQQSTFKGQVREERGWLLQTPWCRNPLFLTAVHRGQVMMFLQTSNKINDI